MDSNEEIVPQIKKQTIDINQIKSRLMSQPQVRELLIKMSDFWKINGFKVKIGGAVIGVVVVVLVAVSIGKNISALNRPKEAQPSAIQTVKPLIPMQKPSIFDGLKTTVTNFATLLPDPAPPAVDPNISLNPAKR